jgi:tRNA(Ile)-lysidine synthase TilS/MesJ
MQNEDYGEVLSRNIVRSATRFLEKRKQEKIAVLLSGGLDSTIIAFCLIKNLKPDFLSRIEFICL